MRTDTITEAREWVGTPYQHQAMLKNVGVDCVGLIVGVGLATGALPITEQEIKAYSGYGRLPNPKRMGQVIRKHLCELLPDEVLPGDIAWIQWRQRFPMHLALVGEYQGRKTLIHALSDARKVAEHSLTADWEARIVSFWRYPGLM